MAYLPLSFSSDIPTAAFMHVNNCGTLLLTDQDYIIDRPDGRSDYLLLYIARGIGYITIANKEYTVYEKQAFIFTRMSIRDTALKKKTTPLTTGCISTVHNARR